jgi:hypothetical protein
MLRRKKMRQIIPYLFLLLISCTRPERTTMNASDLKAISMQQMGREEFAAWCAAEDNPQKHSQHIGNKTFDIKFLPAKLLAMREAGNGATADMVKSAEEHYSGLAYFSLRIKGEKMNGELLKQDLNNAGEYQQRVVYCSFGIQKDISLVTDQGDSIACAICQFERSFDVAPVTDFMLAFDHETVSKAKNLTIILNDNLFHNGLLRFSFTKEELECTPILKL